METLVNVIKLMKSNTGLYYTNLVVEFSFLESLRIVIESDNFVVPQELRDGSQSQLTMLQGSKVTHEYISLKVSGLACKMPEGTLSTCEEPSKEKCRYKTEQRKKRNQNSTEAEAE